MQNKGIKILSETETDVLIEVQAGENWHELVLWALERDYGGIENLALIPGSVGAAPIQNIGAYGVELEDVFLSCEVFNFDDFSIKNFSSSDCEFEYRNSVFKKNKNLIILSVRLKLKNNNHDINTK